jgi:16S rRNA (guanine(966)-N(2))-methyltransferase RsmD
VREALFDILGAEILDAMVLDAFAGTGALGLEALSRGARGATFIESDSRVIRYLRGNIASLGAQGRAVVVLGDVEKTLRSGGVGEPFDIVLADPPYASPVREGLLDNLAREGMLGRRGRVVVERDAGSPLASPGGALAWTRTARYGRTCLDFYARINNPVLS